jgi:ubiquinone/menaquinone biosynthesis C-methylase UbiE
LGSKVVTVDIEPKMIERVERKARAEGITNVEARVADVYDLPFDAGTFDAAYLIAVIGEIPDPDRAMGEFYRVLKPGGTLAFSELLPDPGYPLASTLIRKASAAGFRLKDRIGNFFCYTLVFERE